ncbi:hypothetical protein [Tepidiforma sp.]|jgi:hypothetical protein|uniref:hypothetical protein n=1 Tax=Tepidiforma sp. TaxID=2682230 RepID=UPI0021DBE179|nr:hypothetical protein [Tepidiforma sp.]MCX7617025.1 hypothetical protein [Tepidiforma sp.]GIW18121.1 MAG: hypothetical protein KatS3mg064_1278 [Tepidiforma sp.]
MRFIVTVVFAAILLFLVYLVVGAIADGYFGANIIPDRAVPDAWAAPDSWSEWRDIVIVLLGLFWVLAGILAVVFMAALIALVFAVRKVVRENAAPALDSLRQSLDNIRGTAEFAGETVASPIIRVYAVARGVRSGLAAVTSLPDRIRGRRHGKKKK